MVRHVKVDSVRYFDGIQFLTRTLYRLDSDRYQVIESDEDDLSFIIRDRSGYYAYTRSAGVRLLDEVRQ